jgi:folate-dependent phosphoribosylglycinamide formyltransferase PurN
MYLVNQLSRRHSVAGIVIEAPLPALTRAEKLARRRRLIQRHGLLRTLNKLALNWIRSRLMAAAEADEIRKHFFPDGIPMEYERGIPSITVPNINDAECIDFVKGLRPDLIAVCGTTVIKPAVFALAPLGAVNIHTGITPDYRSADPIFWAIYRGEPHKVGVTIHFVDAGIDTGAIIHQQAVALYRTDTLATIYIRCITIGTALYLRALDEISRGAARVRKHEGTGKAFYSIDLGIVQYLLFLRRFAKLKRGLPAEGAVPRTAEQGE